MQKFVKIYKDAECSNLLERINLGNVYMNGMSILNNLYVENLYLEKSIHLEISWRIESPFEMSKSSLQRTNENMNDEFEKYTYLKNGYNELFNMVDELNLITLSPKERQRLVYCFCAMGEFANRSKKRKGDDEEDVNPAELAYNGLQGKLSFSLVGSDEVMVVPIEAMVCRSMLRVDVDEIRFDDCVPGGSYVKDFAVWNRSEIPLSFTVVGSAEMFRSTKDILECKDDDTGEMLHGKVCMVSAYGHKRVSVLFRPIKVGEMRFTITIENAHDSRNSRVLNVITSVTRELRRDGLLIRDENGNMLGDHSSNVLDFGDSFSGVKVSKVLLIKNTTEANLQVELHSDRSNEISFELKMHHDMVREWNRQSNHFNRQDIDFPKTPKVIESSSTSNSTQLSAANDRDEDVGSKKKIKIHEKQAGDSDEDEIDDGAQEFIDDRDIDSECISIKKQSSDCFETEFDDEGLILDDEDDEFEFDGNVSSRNKGLKEPKPKTPFSSKKGKPQVVTEDQDSCNLLSKFDLVQDKVEDTPGASVPTDQEGSKLPKHMDATSKYLVETLKLSPGTECTILVWFCHLSNALEKRDKTHDIRFGRLVKQNFRLQFKCFEVVGSWHQGQRRLLDRSLGRSIQARARTCTSLIRVSPSIVAFGDCNIGEQKSMSTTITNLSDLPAKVEARVTSKILTCIPFEPTIIQPNQSIDLRIEIIPRKSNVSYNRRIEIVNLNNSNGGSYIEVKASNMDPHNVIYHSLFYKLDLRTKSAYMSIDQAATDKQFMTLFSLKNITKNVLSLKIESSNEQILSLYTLPTIKSEFRSCLNLSALGEESELHTSTGENGFPRFSTIQEMVAYASKKLGIEHAISKANGLSANIGSKDEKTVLPKSRLSRRHSHSYELNHVLDRPNLIFSTSDSLESCNTSGVGTTNALETLVELCTLFQEFPKESSSLPMRKQLEMIKMVEQRDTKLQHLIDSNQIVPLISINNSIHVKPRGQCPVVAILKPQCREGSSDGEIFRIERQNLIIRLPKILDHVSVKNNGEQEGQFNLTRNVLVKARVCESLMSINQKNINFGKITVSTTSSRSVVLQNSSMIPLMYKIVKTGSIASNFLKITEGQMGIVKSFGTRDIRFDFHPALAGHFEERLEIVNLQNPKNPLFITVKAKVVKSETFALPHGDKTLAFGDCTVGRFAMTNKISIRNTTKKRRSFVVQPDVILEESDRLVDLDFEFLLDNSVASGMTTQEKQKLEEELEKYEHKLRIARTKNKAEKIEKLELKIFKAKSLLNGELDGASPTIGTVKAIVPPSPLHAFSDGTHSEESSKLEDKAMNLLRFDIDAESTVKIISRVKPTLLQKSDTSLENYGMTGKIYFFEAKNKDVIKGIAYTLQVSTFSSTESLNPQEAVSTPSVDWDLSKHISTIKLHEPTANNIKVDMNCLEGKYSDVDASGDNVMVLKITGEQESKGTATWILGITNTQSKSLRLKLQWDTFVEGLVVFGIRLNVSGAQPLPHQLPMVFSIDSKKEFRIRLSCDVNHAYQLCNGAKSNRKNPANLYLNTTFLAASSDIVGHVTLTSVSASALPIIIPLALENDTFTEFSVTPNEIDIGEQAIGSITELKFWIRNSSARKLHLLFDRVEKNPNSLSCFNAGAYSPNTFKTISESFIVEPKSEMEISVRHQIRCPGRQVDEFKIRSASHQDKCDSVSVSTCGIRPLYVFVPRLDPNATGQLAVLDFGACYVPADTQYDSHVKELYAKVEKLSIVNIYSYSLSVSAKSNLVNQCYVFKDSGLKEDVIRTILPPGSSIDLFVALRPKLSRDALNTGDCREIAGGIRITVHMPQAFDRMGQEDQDSDAYALNDELATFTVKFQAIAGTSIASIDKKSIDLGLYDGNITIPYIFKGEFSVTNQSNMLPLEFKAKMKAQCQTFDGIKYELVPSQDSSTIIPAMKSQTVQILCTVFRFGYFKAIIEVENLTCRSKAYSVVVSVFVGNGSIKLKSIGPDSILHPTNSICEEIYFDCTGLLPQITGINGAKDWWVFSSRIDEEDTHFATFRCISVENISHTNLRLRLRSSRRLAYVNQLGSNVEFPREMEPSAVNSYSERDIRFFGTAFTLPSGSSMMLKIGLPNFGIVSHDSFVKQNAQEAMNYNGLLAFEQLTNDEEGNIVKLVPFGGTHAVPQLEFENDTINLGTLGYGCSSQSVEFSVILSNVARITSKFRFCDLPRGMSIRSVQGAKPVPFTTDCSMIKGTLMQMAADVDCKKVNQIDCGSFWMIESSEKATIVFDFSVSPEMLSDGDFSCTLKVLNFCNPHNVLQLPVFANVVSKFVEIDTNQKIDYLLEDRQDTNLHAEFPPFVIPFQGERAFVEGCVVVSYKNVHSEEVDISLSVNIAPPLKAILHVHIRSMLSSSKVISFRLGPSENIDLRVCCYVDAMRSDISTFINSNEPARQDKLNLFNVTAKVASISVEDSYTSNWMEECIVFLGEIVEGSRFVVSTRVLNFPTSLEMGNSECADCIVIDNKHATFSIRNPSTTESIKCQIWTESDFQPRNFKLCSKGLAPEIVSDGSKYLTPRVYPSTVNLQPEQSMVIEVKLAALDQDEGASRGVRTSSWDREELDRILDAIGTMKIFICEVDMTSTSKSQISTDEQTSVKIDVLLTKDDDASSEILSDEQCQPPVKEPELIDRTAMQPSLTAAVSLPYLGIRGCTPADDSPLCTRYVVDVGQHSLRPENKLEWELAIYYQASWKHRRGEEEPGSLTYRISLPQESASSWLQISRESGSLESVGSHHNIKLKFSRDRIGSFSTYLLVQSIVNESDIILIRVCMEITASAASLCDVSGVGSTIGIFQALVPDAQPCNHDCGRVPAKKSKVLSVVKEFCFGDLIFNSIYRHRSFVIRNNWTESLEFKLATNSSNPCELAFSLNPDIQHEVTSVAVHGCSSVRVWIIYQPFPSSLDYKSITNKARAKESEIYISCRLVKAYREVIVLKSDCYFARLAIFLSNTAPRDPENLIQSIKGSNSVHGCVKSQAHQSEYNLLLNDTHEKKYITVRNSGKESAKIVMRASTSVFSIVPLHVVPNQDNFGAYPLFELPEHSSIVFEVQILSVGLNADDIACNLSEHVTFYNYGQYVEFYRVAFSWRERCTEPIADRIEIEHMQTFEAAISKFFIMYSQTWKKMEQLIIQKAGECKSNSSDLAKSHSLSAILSTIDVLSVENNCVPHRVNWPKYEALNESNYSTIALQSIVEAYNVSLYELHFLTDELVWYTFRRGNQCTVLTLAELIYKTVLGGPLFKHISSMENYNTDYPIPQSEIVLNFVFPWINQLGHFLSYFPENEYQELRTLRGLYKIFHETHKRLP